MAPPGAARGAVDRTSGDERDGCAFRISLLKTGDLVLFAGPGSWLGRLPWLRRPGWTHVGLVLRRAGDLEPLLWEAQDGLHRGAAIAPLAARIARFAGRIGVRCLSRPLEREPMRAAGSAAPGARPAA